MPISLANNVVKLELPKAKASADVNLFGATVTSWKSAGDHERLFLSKKAALYGSAPIRGGIPLVFPVFGAPSDHADAPTDVKSLDKHGFARNHTWAVSTSVAQVNQENQVSVTLELNTGDKPDIAAIWPYDTLLRYTVTLTPNSLNCKLSVLHLPSSTAKDDLPFQALLHNYLLVPDSTKATVAGLQGMFFIDKLKNFEEGEQVDADIHFSGNAIDRTHVGKIKSSNDPAEGARDVTIQYNTGLLSDPLKRMGKGVGIKRSKELRDTTVWNPAEEGERGIGDLTTGDWKHFICVEPGAVKGFQSLAQGEKWEAEQTLTAW